MVEQKKKMRKIKTREKYLESGQDYQNSDDSTEGIIYLDAIVSLHLNPDQNKTEICLKIKDGTL